MSTKFLTIIALLLSTIFAEPIAAQNKNPANVLLNETEIQKWREDLRYMEKEMVKYHADLFHTLPREKFYAEISKLNERIPNLKRHQIIVEMMRITAMVNDGHSNIYPTRDSKIGFHQLPIKMYFFKVGLFIRAATDEYSKLVGAEVIKIGNATTEQAHKSVLEIIGKDNVMGADFFAPHLLAMPEILHALGLSDNPESAKFTLDIAGKQSVVELKSMGPAETMSGDTDKTLMLKEGWTDLRSGSNANKILWLKNIEDKFWYEYLPESKTVYVQFNEVGNKKDETVEAFSKRLFDFVEANPVEKLVLDLRLNRGGSGGLNKPLLLALIKSEKINQRGKFFAIIGRSTFSAAQFLVDDLEKYTEVIFVGEPSGSKGIHYGDSRKIILPNSGITVRVSVYHWQDWNPWDTRPWTAPDLTAELTSEDYRLNRDPALKAVFDYTPQKPLNDILNEALTEGGVEMAVKKFNEYKSNPIHK